MKSIWLLFSLFTSIAFGSEYPDYPKEKLPIVNALPRQGEVILDVRSTYLSGGPPIEPSGLEIGVFELATQAETIWELPRTLPLNSKTYGCSSCTTASWASASNKLLLTLADNAYLIDGTGKFAALALQMPGVSISYAASDEYAISADGGLIAFRVYTRDSGDTSREPTDLLWRSGDRRLYNDLVYEKTDGSKPLTISKVANYSTPAWSPDAKRIACSKRIEKTDGQFTILIADISGGGVVPSPVSFVPATNFAPGAQITISEIRWNPKYDVLGFLVREVRFTDTGQRQTSALYTFNLDGSDLKPVSFGKKDFNIFAFAWSPSGDMLALRSNYESKTICSLNPLGLLDQGGRPCIISQHLFISNADGSGLKRISKEPKFRAGDLFWIR